MLEHPLQLGVVGGGVAATKLISAIQAMPEVVLCAVQCQPSEMHGVLNGRSRAACYDDLLADDGIEAVYVATPVHEHCLLALAALSAHKHAMIEKPLCLNVDAAVPMLRFASDLVASTAFKKRFGPGIGHLRSLALSLGRDTRATYRWHVPPPPDDNWRYDPARSGGGVVMDLGSHVFDLLEHVFGPVAQVQARTWADGRDNRVESKATVSLRFGSGATASVELSWHARHPRQEFRVEAGNRWFRQNRLSTTVDTFESGDQDGLQVTETVDPGAEYRGLLKAFWCDVRRQTLRSPSVTDGMHNLALIDAVYNSARLGRSMDLASKRL